VHQDEVEFEGVPSSVSAARHFVAEILEAAGASGQSWSAVQVISELATNAVVHAATPFVVQVKVVDSAVRIAVTDRRPSVFAAKRRFSAETTTGRGLQLVERLSRSWGVDIDEASKTVWSEIVRVPIGGSRPDFNAGALTDALTSAGTDSAADSSTEVQPATRGLGDVGDVSSSTPDSGPQAAVHDRVA